VTGESKIEDKREIKAGGNTWITRFFLKRASVCSRRLAPMALVRAWRSREEYALVLLSPMLRQLALLSRPSACSLSWPSRTAHSTSVFPWTRRPTPTRESRLGSSGFFLVTPHINHSYIYALATFMNTHIAERQSRIKVLLPSFQNN
jgi:hypothetical protein